MSLHGELKSPANTVKEHISKKQTPLKKINSARQISLTKPNLFIKNQTKRTIFPEDFFENPSDKHAANFKIDVSPLHQKIFPIKITEEKSEEKKGDEKIVLKKKPLSAMRPAQQKSFHNLKGLVEPSKIEEVPEEEENNKSRLYSSKQSFRSSSIAEKYSNLNYTSKNTDYFFAEEKPFIQIEVRDLTPEKCSDSNADVSTSGSYNLNTKPKNTKIFRFENFEEDLDCNVLKQTACFSPIFKSSQQGGFKHNVRSTMVSEIPYVKKLKSNDSKEIKQIEFHKDPPQKDFDTLIIKNQSNENIIKRSHSGKKISSVENLFSPRNLKVKIGSFNQNHKLLIKPVDLIEKNNKNEKPSLPKILPPLTARRKPDDIQHELKAIFNVAQNFQEDPEVKTKLDSLIKNIADIKSVLRLKSKSRSSLFTAPPEKYLKKLI